MRVRASDGRVVRLTHFHWCAKHIALLNLLQQEVPNMHVEARDEITRTHRTIPVFQLNLDRTELTFLNPEAA